MSEEHHENWSLTTNTNGETENDVCKDNSISTTKYTLLTWLPVSLGDQFKRVANVYFLVISILMLIGKYAPSIFQTPLDPWSTIMTFIFVLAVTCLKEGNEDWKRAQDDRYANEKPVIVVTFDNMGQPVEKEKHTSEIKGGDIIKLSGPTQQVPVDMLLCMTSNYDDGNQCYIETANIDGETNLKLKNAPSDLKDVIEPGGKLTKEIFEGTIEFEPPNKSIYTFIGAFHNKASGNSNGIPLGPENVLLRSSLFSNTDWGYGIALYTGQETKIQMNNRRAEGKMSGIEKLANKAILTVFLAQVVLCTATVISVYALGFDKPSSLPYVYLGGEKSNSKLPLPIELWFVFFLLFNNFIPISLYVTIEMINVGQGMLIHKDETIYDEALNCACAVKNSNLAQELGMVSNIFSDKTGTLTCNEMRFVKFIVDDAMYDVQPDSKAVMPSERWPGTHLPKTQKLFDFLRCLATCHTVIREKDGTYRAESPDELALVEGADKLNCSVLERGTVHMDVSMFDEPEGFQVLAVNAFNSERKRMSVILKSDTGEYFCMCKGADNIMLPLCSMDGSTKNGVEKRLLELARMGLRTLVIAQKKLPTDEAEAWLREYSRAASAMEHRGEKMDACAANLEKGMELLGITAIEDRLQDEVPETIASLAQAGIVVWMLTGDKEETAINIGRSCKLVMNDNKLFMLCGIKAARDNESAKAGKEIFAKTIKEIYDDIVLNWVTGDTPATTGYRDPVSKRIIEVVLVMDGPSFAYFDYDKPEQTDMFLYIGKAVRSVISCRLTPNQKESVVHLIKTNTVPKATCLAIGDGANDVSMILEGDVGVGIFGKEGRQAANNADFAIGQFKFLKTLLLVHGRWNYIRQSQAFLYSLHKNAVITFMLFWYCYFTAVSGTSPFQSWVYSGYNLMLGLPIVFYGILDRDLSREFVEKNPEVYATGKDNVYLHGSAVIGWVANALCYACILCAIFYYATAKTFLDYNILVFGCIAYTGLVMALQLKMIFMSNQWAYPQVSLMFISIIGMIIYYAFVQYWSVDNFYGAVGYMYSGNMFWLFGMFTVPMILMCFEALWYYTQLFFYPTNEMMYREIMHADKFENDMLGADSDAKHLVEGIEMNNSDGSNSSKEGKDQANSDVLL